MTPTRATSMMVVFAAVMAATACGRDQPPPAPSPRSAEAPPTPETGATEGLPSVAGATAQDRALSVEGQPAMSRPLADEDDPCVQACLRSRMAQAIAWDAIVEGCRGQCAAPAPAAPPQR